MQGRPGNVASGFVARDFRTGTLRALLCSFHVQHRYIRTLAMKRLTSLFGTVALAFCADALFLAQASALPVAAP